MKPWKRGEFLFCFLVIWAAALFQGYALYQEWKEEQAVAEVFKTMEISFIEGYVEVSVPVVNDGSTETDGEYPHFEYRNNDDIEQLLQYKTKAERALRMQGLACETNITLKGSKPGKMTLSEKREVTDRLFQSLHAKEVEAVREEELYTVYGYSSLFDESVSYGENEINLNLVFSYDEEKEETIFYLAVPYVQMDY